MTAGTALAGTIKTFPNHHHSLATLTFSIEFEQNN